MEGGLRRPRRQAAGDVRRPLVGRDPRRADVRRAAPTAGAGLARCRSSTPLALLGLLFVPAVVAMYLLKLRRDETDRAVHAAVAAASSRTSRRTPRGSGFDAASCSSSSCSSSLILALLAARPFLERPAGLARDVVLVIDTSASMAATDVAPNRLDGRQDGGRRRAPRPADRWAGERHRGRTDAHASSSTRRPTSAASGRRSTGIAVDERPRRPRRRSRAGRQAGGEIR